MNNEKCKKKCVNCGVWVNMGNNNSWINMEKSTFQPQKLHKYDGIYPFKFSNIS